MINHPAYRSDAWNKAQPKSPTKYLNAPEGADVIITVEGGVVQSIHSIFSLLHYYVADLDNEEDALTPQEYDSLINRIKVATNNLNLVY